MRLLLLTGLALFTFISCSEPSEEINTDPNPTPISSRQDGPGGVYYNSDSVSTPDKSYEFNILKTITLLDTTYSPSNASLTAGTMTKSKVISGDWEFPQTDGITKAKKSIEWNNQLLKWMVIYPIELSVAQEQKDFPVKFNVLFENGKTASRETKISVTHTVEKFDIFKENFGMTRTQVRDNEQKRGDALFYWYEPTLAEATSTNYGFISNSLQFVFSDNKLVSISEFGNYLHVDSPEFNSLIKKLGFNGTLGNFDYPVIIKEPISWIKNGIKFTIHNKDIDIPKGVKNFNVLTYEKAI